MTKTEIRRIELVTKYRIYTKNKEVNNKYK